MTRWLHASETVHLAAADVEERLADLRTLLQVATATPLRAPDGDGSFLLELPARAFGRDVAKQVRVHTGVLRRSGSRVVLPVRWRAEPAAAAFPTFDGTLELEQLARHLTALTLVGSLSPPLGPVGAILDVAVLHRVGDHTATRLLGSLTRLLGTRDAGATKVARTPIEPGSLLVADVMTPAPIVVDEDDPVRSCARVLLDEGVSGLPVLDADGALVGVLSEADLLPRLASEHTGLRRGAGREHRLRAARTAGDACSRPPRCTAPDASLTDAVREMLDHDVSRLVVLEGGEVVGIVTRHDVIRALIRSDRALLAAATALLAAHDAADVHVEVRAGEVRLSGAVELRTVAGELPQLLAAIPGVDHVDAAELGWITDDVWITEPSPFV